MSGICLNGKIIRTVYNPDSNQEEDYDEVTCSNCREVDEYSE